MVFLHLFLGLSLLAAPHYRPAAVVLQTAIHLAGAVFGGSDGRAWHLLIVATGVLFVDPTTLREKIELTQAWLQPEVSHQFAAGGRDGGGGRYSSVARRRRGGGGSDSGSGTAVATERVGGTRAKESGGGDGGIGGNAGTSTKTKKLPLQPKPSSAAAALISVYVLVQALLPLRHVLGDFPVEWSREGHEFSWRGGAGAGGRGGGGGLVREEGLVRVMHRPRGRAGSAAGAAGVQTVHLYGAPLTAQQVRVFVGLHGMTRRQRVGKRVFRNSLGFLPRDATYAGLFCSHNQHLFATPNSYSSYQLSRFFKPSQVGAFPWMNGYNEGLKFSPMPPYTHARTRVGDRHAKSTASCFVRRIFL